MKPKQKQPTTIDEYIADFPKDVQERLQKVRTAIKKARCRDEETIAYGIPTFVQNGNLIHLPVTRITSDFIPARNRSKSSRLS